jgi:flagellar basal body rod protein FlgB
MPVSQIPMFSILRTKMQWHQERQRLLAENVSNVDTPNFKPRDLAPCCTQPWRSIARSRRSTARRSPT